MKKANVARALLVSTAFLSTVPALAQETPAPQASDDQANNMGVGDIIVTAQRREERLQDVPIAITAVTGESLSTRNVTDVLQLATSAPNVQFGQAQGQARLAIRGIGFDTTNPGNEARVAYHIDGIYVSRPGAVLGTFYDVDRVEILRGPQGTLYGRNAVAGNINVLTKNPTDHFEGFAEATIGNYDTVLLQGAVGGPIAEGVSFRIAGQTADRDGFGFNNTTKQDVDDLHTRAVRAKLQFDPSSSLRIRLDADYFKEDDSSGAYHYRRPCGGCTDALGRPYIIPGPVFGQPFPTDLRDYDGNQQPRVNREIYGFGLNIDLAVTDNFSLTSLTGYRGTTQWANNDQDETSLPFGDSVLEDNSKQFSQELRGTIEFEGGSLIIGGYYFREKILGRQIVDPIDLRLVLYNAGRGNLAAPSQPPQLKQGYAAGGDLLTKSLAGFAHLNLDLTDQLSIEVGARYSWEKKQKYDEYYMFDVARDYSPSNPIIPSGAASCAAAVAAGLVAPTGVCFIPYDERTDTAFTPSATIKFKPTDDIMAYATFSKGFKTGGFNLAGMQPSFAPEKLTDYEAGIKADLFDKRVRANISVFHYDLSNVQVNQIGQFGVLVPNAASAKVTGAEAEIKIRPAGNFQLDANIGLLRGRYGDFITRDPFNATTLNLRGNKLASAPPFTLDVGAQNSWGLGDGEITLRGEWHHVAKFYFNQFNVDAVSQATYDLFDAYLSYGGSKGLYGSVYVKNISNKLYDVAASRHSTLHAGFTNVIFGEPRTYGVKVGYRF